MAPFIELAPGVSRLSLRGTDFVNVYLLGHVLVDAGPPALASRLLAALADRDVRAHAITHGHFDHQGGSHAVCARLGIPLWCGDGERRAIETGETYRLVRAGPLGVIVHRFLAGPAHPVERVLREGDAVDAGFVAIETPGHTPGHLAFWRPRDRVLVVGDAAWARNPLSGRAGLREPLRRFSFDPERNRSSLVRLAALDPRLVCFGHGSPADGRQFRAFVAALR